jgi:hypothetical protein
MMHALTHSFVLGASELVRRMIESSGAVLRLNREVTSIQQFRRHVLASCVNGESYQAKLAVIAAPLNVLSQLCPGAQPPQGGSRNEGPWRAFLQDLAQGGRCCSRHAGNGRVGRHSMGLR